jgi:cation transport protein ChaC
MTKLEAFAPPPSSARPLTPEQMEATLKAAMGDWKPGEGFWIFGYGSLMWNPDFTWDARHVATLRGYHRAFHIWSRLNRGTPENPGLVLTLECGGSCRGLVYRIPPERVEAEMQRMWKREMTFGSYRPKRMKCVVGKELVPALAFTVNRQCSGYAGRLPLEVMVEALSSARGRYGPAHDYLFKTIEALREHGIRDERVEHLAGLVRRKLATAA